MKFVFGKRPKNLKFDYIPRFYDEDKENLEKKLESYRGDVADKEKVKSRISQGFRHKHFTDNSFRTKQVKKSNFRLIYIVLLLLLITYFVMNSDALLSFIQSIEGEN